MFDKQYSKIKIPYYRLSIIDRLKHTHKPFATKVANMLLSIDKDIEAENLMASAIIELETQVTEIRNLVIKYEENR